MLAVALVAAGLLAAALLLFRFNNLWIYRVLDRATRNQRDRLPTAYEIPRYYSLKPDGSVDYAARWPGWDGWYFFVLPDDRGLPVKMIRASLMTGLYGLEGIDNYDRLLLRLSPFAAAEALALIPTTVRTPAGIEKRNNFSQHYLPKRSDLRMAISRLETALAGEDLSEETKLVEYGRIEGAWPDYHFRAMNPEAEITVDVRFHGESLVWWADVPGLFTYMACFGRFEGTIHYQQGTEKPDPHQIPEHPETYSFQGAGAFEHGFARKPFGANRLFLPVRLINRILPSFRPIRYHYELLIGDGGHHGGFMQAAAFGVKVRDRGGLYVEGRYIPIDSVRVTYHDDPPPDQMAAHCPGRPPVTFYRRWTVEARTGEGLLSYTGTREWAPAPVAPNMTYYYFTYEGAFRGAAIQGRGYGEYVHI
ncbi:MAG TPA: hypothetical protein VFA33_30425 [Bryobacteraceae bacterium]|nr:hypothetical protein [Bryobacteraceae bacterium]